MELQNGRPDNTEGRLEKELRVYDLLDRLGVAYQRVDHEAAMTMEACEEIDRVLGDGTAICKNLFLCNRQATEFYLLLMPGDKPFRQKNCRHRSGLQDFHLRNRNIWRNIWTSHRGRSAFWD